MKRLTANIAGRDKRFAWLERFVGHGNGFLLLAPFPGYRVLHLHHHANTNDPAEDPDYWVKSRTWLGSVPRCIVIQPVYIFHLWKLARDPRTRRAFAMEMVYVVAYAGIVFAAFLLGFGKELILLWILPGYVGVVLCPAMFDWPVHHPHTARGRYTDPAILLFPRPFRSFMDFIFCGHTYHLMHHLYPRVPFYRYGAAWGFAEGRAAHAQPHDPRIQLLRPISRRRSIIERTNRCCNLAAKSRLRRPRFSACLPDRDSASPATRGCRRANWP